mmetsp:Transcript_23378/g.50026  ORF Transcript_23378/g.50026 Transcript_23378/m.50026 type:complete len:612 (-) Transcript_23378:218-2053(-)
MSSMQHRRPHSNVTVANGDSDSREERRMERRLAKERRGGVKKLRRVKRSDKYRKSPWGWKSDPYFQITFLSFSLFSLVGVILFKTFHHSGESPHWAARRAYQPNGGDSEYNSDNAGGSLLTKLRGQRKYVIPESMENIGTKKRWYTDLRREYDTEILPKDDERSLKFVEAERKRQGLYRQSPQAQTPYDIHNCPEHPPEGYPMQWPVLDVTRNWPTDDPTRPKHSEIYQGICVFDYRTDLRKAARYQRRERPFIMRNDPAVARTAERWNHPGYMEKLLMGNEDTMRRTEYSPNNHFMYWVDKRPKDQRRAAAKTFKDKMKDNGEEIHNGFGRGNQVAMGEAMHDIEEFNELKARLEEAKAYASHHEDDDEAREEVEVLKRKVAKAKNDKKEAALANWQPPTENLRMTYLDWLKHANVTDDKLGPDNPHWYFRLIGCGAMGDHTEDGSCDKGSSEWLFDELTFFQPREEDDESGRPFYLVEPSHQKGIHCRFGMRGVIAENHFDLSRNAITLLGGQRRYILGDPSQCVNMNLLPRGHPSARHSAVDWSNPDLEEFPTFLKTHVNEVVMQPGDVLYLPTNWFHYIVSLELNMQCNTRSGGEKINREYISECGF